MAMFPDSGVPMSDARNSTDPATVNTAELWYSTSRCQPRFDPAAANAMMSELFALVNKGEVTYDGTRLDQLQLAVRYLIQRGLPVGTYLAAGPFDYTCALDPTLTRYSDYLTLVIVPNVDNQGAVTINVDGKGVVPLLRNDGRPLKAKDLLLNRPVLISYHWGNWFLVGLAGSQVPLVATGAVDAWVRTDGNDVLGDGTANTPEKAFRTIQGAWDAVGSRYAASPLFVINVRLGIPGDYIGADLGPYGGRAAIIGDPGNPYVYRIISYNYYDGASWALRFSAANIDLVGVNLVQNIAKTFPNGSSCLQQDGMTWLNNVVFTLEATVPSGCVMVGCNGGGISISGNVTFEGNGHTCGVGLLNQFNGGPALVPGQTLPVVTFRNINFTDASIMVNNAHIMGLGNLTMPHTGVTGRKYSVSSSGIGYFHGLDLPGDQPGIVNTQGQVFP